ncbi:MBL fold metallo-hydrolase [Phycicoccus sp. MAQZ13P-2]|uniref:MBL fold metallo-hydrolase n=1 Tax=Phycicoccus mangrovi TaxID=2840470 RepID=UPI001C000958|nr:MBL fold metallo-hydrolase [Phycicoccus mangrovi]MBT9254912.1 MBL fold metallo-hydrolase [Phycicoccus mangrovi]MBT9256091.1 MBL fold metallo-hydrolase [Phycicoccus mangrovi]MBT9273896.1 MBL fold metallo-hydrolase [Phycicoccus mangrovi]
MSAAVAVDGVPTSPGGVRVERLVTSGVFELDGGSWDVDNNVWLLGDDDEVLVVDAAHDARAILEAIDGRRVVGIVCTHGHNDHVNAVPDLVAETGASVWLHPDDRVLWDMSQDEAPDEDLADGTTFTVGDVGVVTLHTPGHAPGACCLHAPSLGVLFSGDTLFQGGPGATGRSHSDFPTIVRSISTRLLSLPPETVVLTGHGDATTIGDEAPHLQEWLDRGH